MAIIRKYCLGIVIMISCTFCVLQSVSFFYNPPGGHMTHILIDFEDNTEPTEDQKHEKKLKEDKLNKLNIISLERLYLSDFSKFGQLVISHALEIFIEVVTPPPEA